jgi:ubiquinone/menaquinone biosynthesis C-methylase UbiE
MDGVATDFSVGKDDLHITDSTGNFVDPVSQPGTNVSTTSDSTSDALEVPAYLYETYYWSYLNPRNVSWLDREIVVKLILWGQHNKLRSVAFSEIKPGSSVLQTAAVYGNFSKVLAKKIGPDGELKLTDVAPIQVANTKIKLADYPQAEVCLADAATMTDKAYDVVLCYLLLHEVPDDYKLRVMDNLLHHMKPDGKLVIVDYHKPHWAHPLKLITSLVFDTLEPFAKTLWHKPIRALASEPERYDWQQDTFFGGLFQRVVVQHKSK